jgi:hypothetical protein
MPALGEPLSTEYKGVSTIAGRVFAVWLRNLCRTRVSSHCPGLLTELRHELIAYIFAGD